MEVNERMIGCATLEEGVAARRVMFRRMRVWRSDGFF